MDQQTPLVCPSRTTQYIGAVVIGILIGTGASFAYLNQVAPAPAQECDTKASSVQQTGANSTAPTSVEVRTVTGTVIKLSGSTVTLHPDQNSGVSIDDRTVAIANGTKIFKIIPKDPKVFQLELARYTKSKETGGNVPGPEPFSRATATFSSILNGSLITVVASENIKTAKEFSASEILIQ